MHFFKYTSVIAGAALLTSTVASPAGVRGDKKLVLGKRATDEHHAFSLRKRDFVKYFQEPGEGSVMGHYDARYFHGVVSDEERTETQLHMIRAYLDYFRENGLDTWIAHGTLLGWWWNGQRLPWDWDMDTQVSDATLRFMGEKHNQTRHVYKPDDHTTREYLLDVNPWIKERVRGDGMNVIDARWIDVTNGLFIDITGLSEIHPDTAPGVWSCKNYHKYPTSDLYPMRETMFEGTVAKVPYAYDKILMDEYEEKALVVTEFEGHKWHTDQKAWIKTPEKAEQDRREEEQRQAEEKERKEEEERKAKEEEDRKAKEEEDRKAKEEEERKKNEEEQTKPNEQGQ